jgi:Tetracyclin repressor-like, C-terminal domain
VAGDLVRLPAWLRLERRPAGRLSDGSGDEPKIAAIARAEAADHVRQGDPLALFALVIAMSFAWSRPAASTPPPPASPPPTTTAAAACSARLSSAP